MSESEKFEVQGRTYARAKSLKSGVATATAEVNRESRTLADVIKRIEGFLLSPCGQDSGKSVPMGIQLVHDLRFDVRNCIEHIAALVEDIYQMATEFKEVEDQIKNF